MKYYLNIITFFMGVTVGFGQTNMTKYIGNKWTFGTILMSEQNRYFYKKFEPNIFTGIIFKRHLDYYTIRLGIEYITLIDKKDESICCDQFYSEGYANEGMIRLGVEKGITFKKQYRLYFALDLTGIKAYSDKTITGGFAGIHKRVTISTTGLGMTPTVGFEYNIINNLSLALETRLQLINIKTTHNTINSTNTYKEQYDEFRKTLNRIGVLTLNYNL